MLYCNEKSKHAVGFRINFRRWWDEIRCNKSIPRKDNWVLIKFGKNILPSFVISARCNAFHSNYTFMFTTLQEVTFFSIQVQVIVRLKHRLHGGIIFSLFFIIYSYICYSLVGWRLEVKGGRFWKVMDWTVRWGWTQVRTIFFRIIIGITW